jgi:AcrR family transcriptional regulator
MAEPAATAAEASSETSPETSSEPSPEPSSEPETTDRRRVGRPARISREMIAEAALAVGLDGLTLKDVADHLGVSIAALYHHVSGKDDLLRLAVEFSARKVPLPQDHGQHWAGWLLEWANYNFDAFLAEPALLAQYLEGAISPETMAQTFERILASLVRQGFSSVEAGAVYELISATAIGMAVAVIRERNAVAAGQSTIAAQQEVLRERGPDELPELRRLWQEAADQPPPSFHDRISIVILGVAAQKGEDPAAVAKILDAARPPADQRRIRSAVRSKRA